MLMNWPPLLTMRARDVLMIAHDIADQRGDSELSPIHVALGLLREGQSVAVYVLATRGVPLDVLAAEFAVTLPAAQPPRPSPMVRGRTAADDAFITPALREARELNSPYCGAEHLFLALLRDETATPTQVLARHGIGFGTARDEIARVLAS